MNFSAGFLRLSAPRFSRSLATVTHPPHLAPQRHDWTRQEIQKIYDSPLLDLVFRASTIHRQNHDPSKIQLCTLMNIKSTLCSRSIPSITVLNVALQLVDALRTVGSLSCRISILHLSDSVTQARTVLSHPDIPLQPRLHVCLISNLSSKQHGRPKRMEAQGSAWVQHGETSQDAREDSKEFFKWSKRSGVWGWKSARLLACSLLSKQSN